jgi:hypothetical protein
MFAFILVTEDCCTNKRTCEMLLAYALSRKLLENLDTNMRKVERWSAGPHSAVLLIQEACGDGEWRGAILSGAHVNPESALTFSATFCSSTALL